ncbi:metastasis-suppressor KiSS-1 [Trichechus manatus latirostris]|uniref:Metastasis-suppressor KiSS-1 n=1 Tax=Trichechus manatus latirostris TaxID=127582 RepID=A0A2Y9DIN0_TRIMA|nr:metastasis-suppressor KiSS-1 [Trichechus manatus latirostris]
MHPLVSWQLLLFVCATSFRETLERVASAEDPRCTGPQLGPLALLATWEQRCAEKKPTSARPRPRGASLCPPPESPAGPRRPGLCAPRSRLTPSPRGAVLAQREKDLSTYNWNSFGLRYGKRQTAQQAWRGRGAGRG